MKISIPFLLLGGTAGVAVGLCFRPARPPRTFLTHATSRSTRAMFKRSGLAKLQRALGITETSLLDEVTQTALRAYQSQHDIVVTGLPDYESVRHLGLEPNEVFHRLPVDQHFAQ